MIFRSVTVILLCAVAGVTADHWKFLPWWLNPCVVNLMDLALLFALLSTWIENTPSETDSSLRDVLLACGKWAVWLFLTAVLALNSLFYRYWESNFPNLWDGENEAFYGYIMRPEMQISAEFSLILALVNVVLMLVNMVYGHMTGSKFAKNIAPIALKPVVLTINIGLLAAFAIWRYLPVLRLSSWFPK